MRHISNHSRSDPFWKLRPTGLTSDGELCQCQPCTRIMLRDGLSNNPLYCVACNGELQPERIGFDTALAEDIASWLSVYNSLYRLWLDSGEYEAWACQRLLDPTGSVNQLGRSIVAQLNGYIPAYYWGFQDTGAEDYVAPTNCPVCGRLMETYPQRRFLVCEACRMLV